MIEEMVKYASVMNTDGIFIETHPYPELSPSDSENMLELSKFESVIKKARLIYDTH
jgi:3-deoxy-D-manno-octulosonic acid (KDO) 8-phosphate synthase